MKTTASPDSQHASAPNGAPATTAATPAATAAAAPAPNAGGPSTAQPPPTAHQSPLHRYRKWLVGAGIAAALAASCYYLVPWVDTALNTVSTDDAYINGHVTYVAPRVTGQVMKVLVNDNMRVKKGDLLVQLDKEPFAVQVSLKRAAVGVAEANLLAAESKARGLTAQLGSQRWKLQFASEQVDAQIAQLKVKAANLRTQEAILDRARADYERGQTAVGTGALTREDFDQRLQQLQIGRAHV